jgi:hypothetical protein
MAKVKQDTLSRAARELGRRGGLATAARMTPEQRHERAVRAGRTRQAKSRGGSK